MKKTNTFYVCDICGHALTREEEDERQDLFIKMTDAECGMDILGYEFRDLCEHCQRTVQQELDDMIERLKPQSGR